MKFTHYRHATSTIEIDGKMILIDPMLAPKDSYPPIILTKNRIKNPLVNMIKEVDLTKIDGVIITHNHNDHFDEVAKETLPKDIPILCQSDDFTNIKQLGFTNLTQVINKTIWLNIQITRITGTHGGTFINKKLGISSAYILKSNNKTIFLSGDTLFKGNMKRKLLKSKPDIAILNGGGARFKYFGKITMGNKDIIKISRKLFNTTIIAVHMNSLNHCHDKREDLIKLRSDKHKNLYIPLDGETINLIK